MLLQERMKETKWTSSEKEVVDFILNKQELIKEYSTTMIAKETYTSPSILVRIAKKLNFKGYVQFRNAFIEEVEYLKKNFKNIDANTPFHEMNSIMNIANKITQLKQESLNDTLSLIRHDSLQQAIRMMEKSDTIKIFAISNLCFLSEEFNFKIRHIGKKSETYSISNTMYQEAKMTTSKDCAICISYSGASGELIKTVKILKENHVPIIAITSIGENDLSRLSDVTLHLTTREKSYSKIAAFSSLESISLILDILYACYFKTSYQQHYDYKITLSKETEQRKIDNSIIKEK